MKLSKVDEYFLAKRVARMRHKETNYDKHLDLMYDADGNPTLLRRHINSVLGRIATGELGRDYLEGIKSEIKAARTAQIKENHLKNKAKKKSRPPKFPSIEKQQRLLRTGLETFYHQQAKKYLGCIGMKPKQLRKKSTNLLTKPNDVV